MRTLITSILFVSSVSLFSQSVQAVDKKSTNALGVELQVYPAGIIPMLIAEIGINTKSSLFLRAGLNIIDRKDYSQLNEHEEGMGFGGTIGYKRKYFLKKGNIQAGLNLDLWNTHIDWQNNLGKLNETTGQTYTLVLQPWVDVIYNYSIRGGRWQIFGGPGFGREINIVTEGKEVAQGWMGSLIFGFKRDI